jgi:hypothetical protein
METRMDEGVTGTPLDVALDGEGRIAADVSCRHCSYSLRGLRLDVVCPECGTAVRWSIFGDRLLYADPTWARRLANGALWVLIATFVSIIAGIGGGVLDAILGTTSMSYVGSLLGALISLVGTWLITTPEPGRAEDSPIWNVRAVVRILAFVAVFDSVVTFFIFMPGLPKAVNLMSTAVSSVCQLLGVAGAVLFHLLLYRLAVRIPNASLAHQTRIVMWGLGITYTLAAITATITMFMFVSGGGAMMAQPGPPVLMVAMAIIGCPAAIGFAVFGIWSIVLLFRYRAALFAAADAAVETWEQHAGVDE